VNESTDHPPEEYLDEIPTAWELVSRAHQSWSTETSEARGALAWRYNRAIKRFAVLLLREEPGGAEAAGDVAQEVLRKLLEGKFANAHPRKGRFRDYVKEAVRNEVCSYLRLRRREPGRAQEAASAGLLSDGLSRLPSEDQQQLLWRSGCQRVPLQGALSRLQGYQRRHINSLWWTILRMSMDHPDEEQSELIARLRVTTGRALAPEAFRKQLHRARQALAAFLVQEVAAELDTPTPEAVEEELRELGLTEYVRGLLPDDWRYNGRLFDRA
jgi:hypothetical protein